jgi:hypothetical protein
MAGAHLNGGAASVQAARGTVTGSQGGWRLEADWRRLDLRWQMPESEPARLPRRLLPCALARSVEPDGVESDRGLEGGGRTAGNIGSAVAQVCEIIGRACDERLREAASGRLNRCKRRSFGPHF